MPHDEHNNGRAFPAAGGKPNFDSYVRRISASDYPIPEQDGALSFPDGVPHVNPAEQEMVAAYRGALGAKDAAAVEPSPRTEIDASAPMTLAEYERRFNTNPRTW